MANDGIHISDLPAQSGSVTDLTQVLAQDNGTTTKKLTIAQLAKTVIESFTGSSLGGTTRSVKSAIDSLNSKSTNLSKIYRFVMSAGAVSANQSPTITKDYAPDDDVYIQNNVLHFNFSGTVMVMTHVAGATVANNRAWFWLKGNIKESEIHYGEYIAFNNIQIVQVNPSFTFDITAVEAFTINGGDTSPSCIFVTRL